MKNQVLDDRRMAVVILKNLGNGPCVRVLQDDVKHLNRCALSSVDESTWLRTRGSGVRIPQGVPNFEMSKKMMLLKPKDGKFLELSGKTLRRRQLFPSSSVVERRTVNARGRWFEPSLGSPF